MKLFIWDGTAIGYKHLVLQEFGAGLIVALAPDLESALAMIRDDQEQREADYHEKQKMNYALNGWGDYDPSTNPLAENFMKEFNGLEPSEVIDLGPLHPASDANPRYWFRVGSS